MENTAKITKKEILKILSRSFRIDECILNSMIKLGGNPQYIIFKRIAACKEMDRLQTLGYKKEEIYKIIGQRFEYSRIYLVMLPKKYKENFYEFNLCK